LHLVSVILLTAQLVWIIIQGKLVNLYAPHTMCMLPGNTLQDSSEGKMMHIRHAEPRVVR